MPANYRTDVTYYCIGGTVTSRVDGQRHYIRAHEVAQCYGLRTGMSNVTLLYGQDAESFLHRLNSSPRSLQTVLFPDYTGQYALPMHPAFFDVCLWPTNALSMRNLVPVHDTTRNPAERYTPSRAYADGGLLAATTESPGWRDTLRHYLEDMGLRARRVAQSDRTAANPAGGDSGYWSRTPFITNVVAPPPPVSNVVVQMQNTDYSAIEARAIAMVAERTARDIEDQILNGVRGMENATGAELEALASRMTASSLSAGEMQAILNQDDRAASQWIDPGWVTPPKRDSAAWKRVLTRGCIGVQASDSSLTCEYAWSCASCPVKITKDEADKDIKGQRLYRFFKGRKMKSISTEGEQGGET